MKIYASKDEILEKIDVLVEKTKNGKNMKETTVDNFLELRSLIDAWQIKEISPAEED